MARETLWACGKFLTAVDMLSDWLESKLGDGAKGLAEPVLIGLLETLWKHCHATGDPYLGDERVVERAAKWPGERGVLFHALLDCGGKDGAGFIELDPDRDGYRIHDYFDHAPKNVRERAKRETQRRAEGRTISEDRRRAALARWSKRDEQTGCKPVQAGSTCIDAVAVEVVEISKCDAHACNGDAVCTTPYTLLPTPDTRHSKALPDLPPSIDTPEMRAAWAERLQERREKGARGRLTPSQVASQFRDLEKVAAIRGIGAAVACVERATSGGNQGVVFPEDKLPAGSGRGDGRSGSVDRQRPLAPGTTPEHVRQAQDLDRAMGLIS